MPATSAKPRTPYDSGSDIRGARADSDYSAGREHWNNVRVSSPIRTEGRSPGRTIIYIAARLLVVAVGAAVVVLLEKLL